MWVGPYILLLIVVVLISSSISDSRRQKKVARFISTRKAILDREFLETLEPEYREGQLVLNVRKLVAEVVGIPTDYIYSSDRVEDLMSITDPSESFTERFGDLAQFEVPEDFEVEDSETVLDIIRRLASDQE